MRRSYGSYNRYNRRSVRERYEIMCNGMVIGTAIGSNALDAIRAFAGYQGIRVGVCQTFGECGSVYKVCKRYYGCYACGRQYKCRQITCVDSSIGILYAIKLGRNA